MPDFKSQHMKKVALLSNASKYITFFVEALLASEFVVVILLLFCMYPKNQSIKTDIDGMQFFELSIYCLNEHKFERN